MANCKAMTMGKGYEFRTTKPIEGGKLRGTTKAGAHQIGKGEGHKTFNPSSKQERGEKFHSSRKD